MIFYLMSIWGVALSAVRAYALPSNWVGQRLLALGLGALCIAAMAIHFRASAGKGRLAAYLLLTVSLAGSILWLVF